MSREAHEEFLKRSARQALAKARARRHQERWSASEIRELKIQTVEPWKRVLFGILGTGAAVGGVLLCNDASEKLGLLLLIASLVLMVLAAVGIRRSFDAVLNGLDLFEVVGGIVDLIDL